MKAGGDRSDRASRLGSMSPANLLDGELVERHVGVQGADDPIAIGPDRARPVLFIAVRVGVAGQVEPAPRPALAVMGRGEQPIDEPLVGVGRRVVDEGVDLLRRGRQADQVERQRGGPACSGRPRGDGRRPAAS